MVLMRGGPFLTRNYYEYVLMVCLDSVVNMLVNTKRGSTRLFARDFMESQRKGVEAVRALLNPNRVRRSRGERVLEG
jgi:nickel-dependent lactate racemase